MQQERAGGGGVVCMHPIHISIICLFNISTPATLQWRMHRAASINSIQPSEPHTRMHVSKWMQIMSESVCARSRQRLLIDRRAEKTQCNREQQMCCVFLRPFAQKSMLLAGWLAGYKCTYICSCLRQCIKHFRHAYFFYRLAYTCYVSNSSQNIHISPEKYAKIGIELWKFWAEKAFQGSLPQG